MERALTEVLGAIARAVLGECDDASVTAGSITLRPHQRDALRRVKAAIARSGGALLADEPGLGKTFVALALAREFTRTIVVAPAALRQMWRGAAAAAGVETSFVSFEALSRGGAHLPASATPGEVLMIVDEAHHACNPGAARYARLARLTANHRVLLLSATPVRNRGPELSALLALFLGPRAQSLDDAARARLVVRRDGDAALLPAIDGPHWHRARAAPGVAARIASLPPPLPALDGRAATALLAMTLARCWASSLAALEAALRRRLQRGAALGALLDAGRLPTRDELRSWVVGDDAVQLAFPIFAAHESPDAARLRAVLDAHLAAVRALRERILPKVEDDARSRSKLLLELRRAREGAVIVAFTSHAATAEALYRALRRERGVALLTARGARTAGGARPRSDVIDALGADRRAGDRDGISLVITTDLLSEGVNLQGASVIVHLDVPWTPSGLDQRVGRAARMGSPHACVHVHGISPPAAAERLLTLGPRLTTKRAEQSRAVEPPRTMERLRAVVRTWRPDVHPTVRPEARIVEDPAQAVSPIRIAGARAARAGFIAVVEASGEASLLCGTARGRRWKVVDSPGQLLALASAVNLPLELMHAADLEDASANGAIAAIDRWLAARSAREAAGAGSAPSAARRRLLALIDSAALRAPAHTRAALAARIAGARRIVESAVSAGAERTLAELTRAQPAELESLLAACETQLAPAKAAARARGPGALRALLLLRG